MPRATHPYQHGTLRDALIEATEALLTERGAEGFSLREVARLAGVSPARHRRRQPTTSVTPQVC